MTQFPTKRPAHIEKPAIPPPPPPTEQQKAIRLQRKLLKAGIVSPDSVFGTTSPPVKPEPNSTVDRSYYGLIIGLCLCAILVVANVAGLVYSAKKQSTRIDNICVELDELHAVNKQVVESISLLKDLHEQQQARMKELSDTVAKNHQMVEYWSAMAKKTRLD